MEIPQGSTREDIKVRRQIIKDFYAEWIATHPEKRVWNRSLKAYIVVKNISTNEALGHAPRYADATLAQLQLSTVLAEAVYIENRPPKYGDKNQKSFSKMFFLRWQVSRVVVGLQTTTKDYVLYCISGGSKKIKAVR